MLNASKTCHNAGRFGVGGEVYVLKVDQCAPDDDRNVLEAVVMVLCVLQEDYEMGHWDGFNNVWGYSA